MNGYMTWRELKKAIKHMPKEQLDEPVYVWASQEDVIFDGVYMVHEGLDTCDGGKATDDNPYALDMRRYENYAELYERRHDELQR